MTKSVTGTYPSNTQIQNAREDLIAAGIPQEQIYVDKAQHQLKVLIADATEPEVEEILKRHDATSTRVTSH